MRWHVSRFEVRRRSSKTGEAFTAACGAQTEAQRLTYRNRNGERLLFRDLVRDHYLPSLRDASPNTRKNTASHLGDGSGVATRLGRYGERAARSQLLFAFGHLPIGGIGPNEVQHWISQVGADGYDVSTMRAKRSLLRVAVDQGRRVFSKAHARKPLNYRDFMSFPRRSAIPHCHRSRSQRRELDKAGKTLNTRAAAAFVLEAPSRRSVRQQVRTRSLPRLP